MNPIRLPQKLPSKVSLPAQNLKLRHPRYPKKEKVILYQHWPTINKHNGAAKINVIKPKFAWAKWNLKLKYVRRSYFCSIESHLLNYCRNSLHHRESKRELQGYLSLIRENDVEYNSACFALTEWLPSITGGILCRTRPLLHHHHRYPITDTQAFITFILLIIYSV